MIRRPNPSSAGSKQMNLGTFAAVFLAARQLIVPVADAPIDMKSAAVIERGRDLFNQACSNCHGENGTGGLIAFRGRKDLSAEQVFDTISNGRVRGSNIMPAWKESLSDAERWELTAFIVSLAATERR
jgi:mono/diheme cytochrome c family protein